MALYFIYLMSLVILSKGRSPSISWPETKLGPIGAINPKYPLPGYVGLIEYRKKTEVSLMSAINNLPTASSQHYASVLLQAEYNLEVRIKRCKVFFIFLLLLSFAILL